MADANKKVPRTNAWFTPNGTTTILTIVYTVEESLGATQFRELLERAERSVPVGYRLVKGPDRDGANVKLVKNGTADGFRVTFCMTVEKDSLGEQLPARSLADAGFAIHPMVIAH